MTMLQDSLRSAVYRSLTKPLADGCQNEKNQTVAVACTTHTLSKISNSNSNPVQRKGHRELEEKAMEHRDKGELTRSVDFMSRHSAEDLEESIAMLSKLQEASKRMSHSKPRKKREEILLEEDRNDDIMSSRRFSVQEPRFSVDGSSKNYTEEQLRRWRMSRSKYRQRSEFMNEEFGVSERMSSRRFGFQEQRHSVDGSAEEMHRMSRLFQLNQRSEFQEEDIGVEGRLKPRFSFDGSSRAQIFKLQEPRFSDSIEELRSVIKNSLCQQNLLSRSPEDDRTGTGHSLSPWRGSRFQRFKGTVSNDDDAEGRLSPSRFVSATPQAKTANGPNLIAKLMGLEEVSPLQKVEPIKKEEMRRSLGVPIHTSDVERPTARKLQLVEKKKKKKASPKQKSLLEIIEAMQSKGLLKSGQFDAPSIKAHRFDGEQQLKKYGRNFRMDDESPPIVIMKPLYLPQWERGEVQRYLPRDKSVADDKILNADLIQEKRVSDRGPMLQKPLLDRKEVKRIEKAKVDFSTASSKQQRQVAFKTRKKADEQQKPQLEEKKRPAKTERMPISQSTAARSDKRLSTAKNKVSPVKPESTKNSVNPLKERKILRRKSEKKSTDIQMDDKSCKNDKEANPVHKMDTVSDTANLPADKILQQTKKEIKTYEKDAARVDQKPLCEVMPKTNQAKKIPEVVSDTKPAARKEVSVEDDLMSLLLNSKSFLTRAQELYGIDAPQPVHHQTKGIEEDVTRNAKFYIDCGNELMARKSHKHELMMYPTSQAQMCGLTASFTLHQLAEEISSRIRTLTSYTKADRNVTSDDVLYLRLERDLTCNDASANAMWDIGWLNWGFPEEAVQLACEVEESILSLLVAEVATELVY